MLRIVSFLIALFPAAALAQDFVPITIDAAKYQQIDEAMSQMSMPRTAHQQWLQLWQQLERQAVSEKAAADAKAKAFEKPVPPPPGK